MRNILIDSYVVEFFLHWLYSERQKDSVVVNLLLTFGCRCEIGGVQRELLKASCARPDTIWLPARHQLHRQEAIAANGAHSCFRSTPSFALLEMLCTYVRVCGGVEGRGREFSEVVSPVLFHPIR